MEGREEKERVTQTPNGRVKAGLDRILFLPAPGVLTEPNWSPLPPRSAAARRLFLSLSHSPLGRWMGRVRPALINPIAALAFLFILAFAVSQLDSYRYTTYASLDSSESHLRVTAEPLSGCMRHLHPHTSDSVWAALVVPFAWLISMLHIIGLQLQTLFNIRW